MKKIIVSLVLVAFIALAQAGTPVKSESDKSNSNVLRGKVIDKKTGEALVGAIVKINNTDIKAYTDLDGNFEIKNIKEGQYSLVISYISYIDSLIENALINNKTNNILEIELLENK